MYKPKKNKNKIDGIMAPIANAIAEGNGAAAGGYGTRGCGAANLLKKKGTERQK
jgi:hypothetical protein